MKRIEFYGVRVDLGDGDRLWYLDVDGDLDAATLPDLRRALGEVPHGCDVIVDLIRVRSVDPAAARILERARHRLVAEGQTMRICNAPQTIAALLAEAGAGSAVHG